MAICKKNLCNQPCFMITDSTAKESKRNLTKRGVLITISYGLMSHPSGLCYFHLKKDLGLFDAHYPLEEGEFRNIDI